MSAASLAPPAAGRSPSWKWWVCGLLLLATMVNYMDRLTLNQLAKEINDTFGLSELEYGYLESAFGSAFALGAIIAGWLADRWNVRWMYALAVFAWSMAGFATGLVTTFAGLLLCRFLLGLAEAGNWPCALKTTQRILPPSERTMGNSILQSGAAIGAVLTPLIVLGLMSRTNNNWRVPFMAVGAIGALWVLLWLASVRSRDLEAPQRVASPSLIGVLGLLVALMAGDFAVHRYATSAVLLELPGGLTVTAPLASKLAVTVAGIVAVFSWLLRVTRGDGPEARAVFFRRLIVLSVLVVAINVTWHFFRAWLPLFLRNEHGYSLADYSFFSSAYYLAADVGSLTAGFVTLYLARTGMAVHSSRVAVFGTCAVLTALSVLVPQLATGPALVAVLLVVGFACLGLFPNYYSFSQELSAAHQGKVSGALGCINWLVMALLHEVVGDTVKRTGSYTVVMSAAGLVPLLGLVVLLLFWGPAPSAEPALAAKLVPSSGDAPGPTSDRPPVDADTPASAEPTPARVG